MTMVSYAQNAEDVVLRRLFPPEYRGLYIDVGANNPLENSVTRHFYERGWRGINIEPGTIFEQLQEHRPEDVNLNVGLSNTLGAKTFYDFVDYPGSSTYCEAGADLHRNERGFRCLERIAPVTTLKAVCEEHVDRPIDFISIDVEGHERQVLEGGDWSRFRPVAIVLEATQPNSNSPTHQHWEDILSNADYRFALFDGLNRYYVRAEDSHLLARLSAPANCCDDFIPYSSLKRIAELQNQLTMADNRIAVAEHRLAVAAARLSTVDYLGPRSLAVARRLHDFALPFHRVSCQLRQIVRKAS